MRCKHPIPELMDLRPGVMRCVCGAPIRVFWEDDPDAVLKITVVMPARLADITVDVTFPADAAREVSNA